MSKVSIIVPVYNAQKYLERSLGSICRQTYENLEIILVNDGSEDESARLCEEWSKRDTRITVIYQENAGVAAARNRGLDAATGQYIMFVDADDWIATDMVERLHKMLVIHDADVATCNYKETETYPENPIPPMHEREVAEVRISEDDISAGIQLLLPWCVYCKLFRRELLEGIRFQKYRIAEDLLFNTDIICSGKLHRTVSIDAAMYDYFQNPESAIHQGYQRKYMEGVQVEEQCYDRLMKLSPRYGDLNIVGCSISMFFEKIAELDSAERKNAREDFRWCKRNARQYKEALLHTSNRHRKISGMLKVYVPDLYLWTLILRKRKGIWKKRK